jgi:putative CocE/NonD family hydrolase
MIFRRAGLALAAAVSVGSMFAGLAAPRQGTGTAAPFAGYQRAAEYSSVALTSIYVPMRDGVRLAVDVVLPADLPAGTRLPALLNMTPYWRGRDGSDPTNAARFYAMRGYAFLRVDVRGTGASFGIWRAPQSPDEVADGGDLVAWIVKQPWSNGRVGAVGTSYEGSTAQMLLVAGHAAVQAVIPRFHEFDAFADTAFPGGVFDEAIVRNWGSGQQQLATSAGVRRVDEDTGGELLKQALASRSRNVNAFTAARQVTYRDDRPDALGFSFDDISPFRHRAAIERTGAAIYGWGSWMDAATADTCIRRFLTFSNPQQVVIGPWSHGAGYDANPLNADNAPVSPSPAEQQNEDLRFFDLYLKDIGAGSAPRRSTLTYYTMGESVWRTTDVWPIPGTSTTTLFFAENHALSRTATGSSNGADRYTVDFSATTGTRNRWHTENGGGDVVYPDRAAEDRKLLTYTSEPLREDTEITGYPIVHLSVASTATDGAFFVYLEDVDPAGSVTYLTEGMLRALHRKTSTAEPPFKVLVPYHSFTRADAAPLVPGQMTKLDFGLLPVSVLLPAGHRLRVAIAGADSDTFARIPAGGRPSITVGRNRSWTSSIDLPIVARAHARPTPRPSRAASATRAPLAPAPIENSKPSPPTTATAILDRYVEALGGRAALEKITSRLTKGTFAVPERGVSGPFETAVKPPKFAMRVAVEPLMGQGYDGEIGWDLNLSNAGLTTLTGDQAAGLRRQADLNRDLRLKDELEQVQLAGMARVDGKPAYVLEGTPTGLRRARFYFDVETGLLVRRDTLGPPPQAAPIQIVFFEDQRLVDGVMVAFRIRTQLPASTQLLTIESVRFNVAIDDAVFRIPR